MQGRSPQRWTYAAVLGLFLSVAGLSYLIDLPGVLGRSPIQRPPSEPGKNPPSAPPSKENRAAQTHSDSASLGTREWIRAEAGAVDAYQVDENTRLAAIEERIVSMQEPDWNQVVDIFLDAQAGANERVLSAFLLGRGGYRSPASIDRIFDEKLPSEPAPAHSSEEMSQMREKSLRLMVLEGLIAEAKQDPEKKPLLLQSLRRIDDPSFRKLAERRLREEGIQ